MFIPTLLAFTLAAPGLAAATPPPASSRSPVPYPHPLITEVLYAVPGGRAGDANGDGERQPLGDEFIELVNPHDRPINLKGYTLVDADAYSPGAPRPSGNKPGAGDNKNAEVQFTFPDCELKPGQVALVFNGYKCVFDEPAGDQARAASGPSRRFHKSMVFSMGNTSPYAAFGNDGDFILLSAPDGKPVHGIKWGKPDKNLPSETLLSEDAPIASGSVQRDGLSGKLVAHKDLGGDFKGSPFSPGLFSASAASPADTAAPDPKPAQTSPAPAAAPATDAKPAPKPSDAATPSSPAAPRDKPGGKPRK